MEYFVEANSNHVLAGLILKEQWTVLIIGLRNKHAYKQAFLQSQCSCNFDSFSSAYLWVQEQKKWLLLFVSSFKRKKNENYI